MVPQSYRRCQLAGMAFFALVAGRFAMGQINPTEPPPDIVTLRAPGVAEPAVAPPADALTLKTQRVVIFKDGYGLVIKDGTATADAQGHVFTAQVPESAVLGTVWALSDQNKILSMTAQWDKQHDIRKETSPCLTQRELLRANVNHRITVELDDRRTITGTVTEILEAPNKTDAMTMTPIQPGGVPGQPFFSESDVPADPFDLIERQVQTGQNVWYSSGAAMPIPPSPETLRLVRELTPRGGDFVVINGDVDHMVLPISKIVSISGKDVQTTMTRESEVFARSKRLTFDFGKAAAGKPVELHFYYFTPGFKWIPTYRITGNLKDQADVALQGEIVNDLEDITDANVDLVVGVPNFRFKDVVSPLVLETVLRNAIGNQRGLDNNGNLLNSQFGFNNSYSGRTTVVNPELPAEILAGSGGEQDLFIYPLENFSLSKDGRASAALWQSTVPVRNVYTYEVTARRNAASGGQVYGNPNEANNPSGPNHIVFNQIWHQLELTNDSKKPWTTGAAITMQDNLPLGQDILTYTSVGGKTLLPLTIAVDLRGTTDEVEVSRKPNAANFGNHDYTLVQKKGTITVSNNRKEDSEMCVSISVGGKIEAASDSGKIKINDFHAEDWDENSYAGINNHSDVSWEFALKPGETKAVDYTVSFYVP